jgi:hypothetical protein
LETSTWLRKRGVGFIWLKTGIINRLL